MGLRHKPRTQVTQTVGRTSSQQKGNYMKANIFCNVCKKPLQAVKEWGKNEVDVYVIPCENCAAQQGVQLTAAGVESDGENQDSGGN